MSDDQHDQPDLGSVRLTTIDDRPVIEVTVAAPVEVVWPHLRRSELIRRWHGWEFDGLDAEIELIFHEHTSPDDAAHVLRPGGPGPEGDRFEAIADGEDSTVIRITRGPRGLSPDWDAMYDDITEGWISFLAQLRFAVEQQLGRERRTVFVMRAGEPAPAAAVALGLSSHDTENRPAEIVVADEPLAATVWFATDGQIGLAVPRYGPGLVVVADKPGPTPGSAVLSMIIVSTFGLSDPDHRAVEASWQRWWAEHYPESATPDPGAGTADELSG